MKKYYYILSFLFLFILIGFSLLNNKEKKSVNTSSKADSLHNYYVNTIRILSTNPVAIKHIDSFIKVTSKNKLDRLTFKSYMVKTRLLSNLGKQLEALSDSKELLRLSTEKNDSVYIGKANYKIALYNEKLFNYQEAFDYYNRSFAIHRDLKDSLLAPKRLLSMSKMQRNFGDYIGNSITATDGLKYINNLVTSNTKLGLYQEISISFREQGNYKEALLWSNKIISTIDKYTDSGNVIVYKNTRANIFKDLKKYKQSTDIFKNLLKDTLVINNPLKYAQILSNYAYCKWVENQDNSESEKLLLTALSIRESKKNYLGLIASNIHLANYYIKIDSQKAVFHANQAYKNAKKINNKVEILAALDLITSIDSTTIEKLQEYKTISKSLEETRKKIRQIYAPTRFENERLTAETTKKEKQLKIEKEEKRKTIFWMTAIALSIFSLIILYYVQRQKIQKERTKAEKLKARIDTEKKLSKKVHDSIANDLYFIKILINRNAEDAKIIQKLNIVYDKARNISRENNDIDFQKYKEYLKEIINSYISQNVNIFEKGIDDIRWDKINEYKKSVIYQVIKELMVNMYKHSNASIVSVIFKVEKKKVLITYTDNGIGFSSNNIKSRNGISIMENLTESCNGTINFDLNRDYGIKVSIKIPC
ncbi:hypothetical protein H2O64_14970 [Kordia sp. YSTF-M3]|uniref:histidine kinase n=1 Tax=Kordia aestuariivivens TaxID=2759037 RepID=A0ABR7QC58_9FLAO|nr:ATP-binding protein [Kordia aestuariivivens]MBC8755978.1 hypothetical protein [Kordia aestuariivivens]